MLRLLFVLLCCHTFFAGLKKRCVAPFTKQWPLCSVQLYSFNIQSRLFVLESYFW